MSPPLLPLDAQEFAHQVQALSPLVLSESTIEALHRHYQELRRWSPRLNLIGPGTVGEILSRHYGESLAALPLIGPEASELVDLGSGAGFPGLVLAAALPRLRVTLVEARQRKWAFLRSAARKASLPCRCLNARVEPSLPPGLPERIDVVTARALRLSPDVLQALKRRLSSSGQILLWVGAAVPALPRGLEIAAVLALPGSEQRRILSLRRSGAGKDDLG